MKVVVHGVKMVQGVKVVVQGVEVVHGVKVVCGQKGVQGVKTVVQGVKVNGVKVVNGCEGFEWCDGGGACCDQKVKVV